MAAQTDHIVVGGYTYRVGDTLKVNNNIMYTNISATSGNNVNMLTQCVMKIVAIYYNNGVGVTDVRNPIQLAWQSGPNGSYNGGGFIRTSQIAAGSGGTPNTYTIVYNANGGSGSMANTTVTYGVSTKLRKNSFTKTGHSFTGWIAYRDYDNKWYGYNSSNTQGWYPQNQIARYTVYKDEASVAKTAPSGTCTFYAQWKVNTYTITYTPNGGSGSNQTQSVTYGSNWTSKGAIYSRTGYTQDYWTLNSASGDSWGLNATAPYGWASNITLYAHWKINQYTLTVNPNGGAWNGNTTTKSYTQNYNSTKAIPNPTRSGHTFTGWTKSGTGTLSGTTFRYGAGNCTLTATWKVNSYSITFNANGGSGAPGTQTGNYNSTITLSSTKPTRTGYNFSKWNTKANGSGVSYNPGTKINITGNMTLYAIWTAKTVKVTFYRNTSSSDNTTATQTFTYGVSGQTFSNKGWSRTGYTLLGWSENRSATTAQYSTLSGVQNSWINSKSPSVSIYAVWKKTTNIYVYTGGSFKAAIPYIYTGGKWVQCTIAYIYTSGGWKS